MHEADLTDRCVQLLTEEQREEQRGSAAGSGDGLSEPLRAAVRKFLVFMGLGGGVRGGTVLKVLFFKSVAKLPTL